MTIQETMQKFVDAKNAHDVKGVLSCFSPSFRRRSAETQWEEMGIGNYGDMSDRFWKAFPDTHFEVQHLLIDGNFVFLQYKETGTWTGLWEMPGDIKIPAQNAPYETIAIITCEMDSNNLIEKYCYYCQNGFVRAYPILNRSRVVTKNEEADKKREG